MSPAVYIILFLLFFCPSVLIAMVKLLPKLASFSLFIFGKRPEPGRKHIDAVPVRPAKYTSSEIKRLMQGNYADLGRDRDTGQRFLLDEDARCKTTAILGPPGAGKSSWFFSTTLAADIAHKSNSVIIFDPQNDVIREVQTLCKQYGRRLYIYPDIGFNPLNLVKTTAQERAKVFNDVLSQVTQVGEDAQYYLGRQQLFIRQLLPLFEAVYKKPMILRELWELCLSKERREEFKADAQGNPLLNDYTVVIRAWQDHDFERNLSGLVNFIDTVCAGENVHFYNQRYAPTIEEMIAKQEVCIIREGDDKGTEGHVRGLLYMVAIQEATNRRQEDSHLVILYIDEFHRYLNPSYKPFVATCRKRRIAQVLAFQSLGQLVDNKGMDYTNTIMSCARTCVVHTGLSPQDAEYIADRIGKRQFVYTATGESRNKDQVFKERQSNDNLGYDYAFYPHEIMNLDQNLSLILSVKERGLDAPRFVEKPQPLRISKSSYTPPIVRPFAPPTVWDGRPPKAANSGTKPTVSVKLENAIDNALDKAKQKNNANKNQNRQQNQPKPGQAQKKKGQV